MLKFVVLAIVLTSALGIDVQPPPPGCALMTTDDGKSVVLCNGTRGIPGPAGPVGIPGPECERPKCCSGPQGPEGAVGNPGQVGNPSQIQNPSFIWSMLTEALWLPARIIQGALNTAYEVVVRAMAFFVQQLLNMAALALVTWAVTKFYPKIKQAPAMATDYFAGMQGQRLS